MSVREWLNSVRESVNSMRESEILSRYSMEDRERISSLIQNEKIQVSSSIE